MSHIDEGELTAYADGAYAPADAEAQRIAAHIAECANCRNRLAQAQMLSGRASEILAVASPVKTDAPPFEEIAANIAPRTRRHGAPLQWAASIILAVGLGWFGRDALYQEEPRLEMSPAPTPQDVASKTAQPAQDPVPGEVESTEMRAEPVAGRAARASDAVAEATPAVVEPPAPATPPTLVPLAATAPAAEAATPKSLRTPTQQMAASELARQEADASEQIEYITAAEAEARKLTFHIVPELEVVRIGLMGSDIRVEQKLPDGKIVTVESGRPAVYNDRPSAGVQARTEVNEVAVTRGANRVTISGALSADSLRVLAAKIR